MKSVFTDIYSEFLTIMINARKETGLTQAQLANLLNKPQSFISKYERRERRLDVVEFLTIAKILELDPYSVIKKLNSLINPKSAHKESTQ